MNLQAFEKTLKSEDLYLGFSPEWVDSGSVRNALPSLKIITEHVGGIELINLGVSPLKVKGKGGISLSHSKKGGTVLVSPKHVGIGVDLEEKARLTEKVLNRVSSEAERASAPDLLFLWPAKEASFKALYPDNEDLAFTQLTIQNWKKIDSNIWTFESRFQQKTIGGFLLNDDFLLVAATFLRL